MGIQQFEQRLERLVEGVFSRTFRSGVEPVEIGRKLVRALESGRQIGVRGTVAPNRFVVTLADDDAERFTGYHEALAAELADAAREHARSEGYRFQGPVTVELAADARRKRGDVRVTAEIVEGDGPPALLVLADGRSVPLGEEVATIGRISECAVCLSDTQVSRRHAQVQPTHDGFRVVDLDSTNGTFVNERRVSEQPLTAGDQIRVGATVLRYEEA